jgi:hypothetical protein
MFFSVTCSSGCACGCMMGEVLARAYGVVISARLEAVGVTDVKTVCGRKAGDSGGDEVVSSLSSSSDGRGRFVSIRGLAGNMGGVVGWGVILTDFGPHCLFRGDVSNPSREPEKGGKVLMYVL